MLAPWFERLIIRSSIDLEGAGKTIFQFSNKIRKRLVEKPVQEWEAALWARGLNRGLLKQESYFFRAGPGKRSSLSLFVRNEHGQYVGLRRESITQAATFVTLVTDYGYPRSSTRFESQWMDVVVYDGENAVDVYAENKASLSTLLRLCHRLESDFADGVPRIEEDALLSDRRRTPRAAIDDAVMKAQHIWRHRPRVFWAVCPTFRQGYLVDYLRDGFRLEGFEFVPAPIGEPPPALG